MSGYYDIKCVS